MASRASIAGHPIHPMLVPLPIGLFVFSFVADLATLLSNWGTNDPATDLTDLHMVFDAFTPVRTLANGDPDVIGRSVTYDGRPAAVQHRLQFTMQPGLYLRLLAQQIPRPGERAGAPLAWLIGSTHAVPWRNEPDGFRRRKH